MADTKGREFYCFSHYIYDRLALSDPIPISQTSLRQWNLLIKNIFSSLWKDEKIKHHLWGTMVFNKLIRRPYLPVNRKTAILCSFEKKVTEVEERKEIVSRRMSTRVHLFIIRMLRLTQPGPVVPVVNEQVSCIVHAKNAKFIGILPKKKRNPINIMNFYSREWTKLGLALILMIYSPWSLYLYKDKRSRYHPAKEIRPCFFFQSINQLVHIN